MTTYTDADMQAWQIVPYGGKTSFKRVRVRDDDRIRQIVRHLQAHECVSLIGPPFSEKSRLLDDVTAVLEATGLYRSLYLDLWDTNSDDEAAFFTSLAWLIHNTLLATGEGGARGAALGQATLWQAAIKRRLPPQNEWRASAGRPSRHGRRSACPARAPSRIT